MVGTRRFIGAHCPAEVVVAALPRPMADGNCRCSSGASRRWSGGTFRWHHSYSARFDTIFTNQDCKRAAGRAGGNLKGCPDRGVRNDSRSRTGRFNHRCRKPECFMDGSFPRTGAGSGLGGGYDRYGRHCPYKCRVRIQAIVQKSHDKRFDVGTAWHSAEVCRAGSIGDAATRRPDMSGLIDILRKARPVLIFATCYLLIVILLFVT